MSFWRNFGFYSTSTIDTTLNKQDLTIEDLLEDEELLQEVKSQNQKLLEVITRPEHLSKLITYITEETDPVTGSHKWAYASSEVLASDVDFIADAVFNDPEYIDRLVGALCNPPPLNPSVALFTSHVLSSFIERRKESLYESIKNKEGFLDSCLENLDNVYITDLLIRLIERVPYEEASISQWLEEADLIRKLIEKISPDSLNREAQQQAARILTELSKVQKFRGHLQSENSVKSLLNYISSENELYSLTPNPSLGFSLQVLDAIISEAKIKEFCPESEVSFENLPVVFKLILLNLSKFKSALQTRPGALKIRMTVGEVEPAGSSRLQVLDLFHSLSKSNYGVVHRNLMEADIFNLILDSFFYFKWNNFLHALVYDIVYSISRSSNEELKKHLIEHCNFPERVGKGDLLNQESIATKNHRIGYIGHLHLLGRIVDDLIRIKDQSVSSLSNDNNSPWAKYYCGNFQETLRREGPLLEYPANNKSESIELSSEVSSDEDHTALDEFKTMGQYYAIDTEAVDDEIQLNNDSENEINFLQRKFEEFSNVQE